MHHSRSNTLKKKRALCKSKGLVMSRKDKKHRCIRRQPLICKPKAYSRKTRRCRIRCKSGKQVRRGTRNRCVRRSSKKIAIRSKKGDSNYDFGLKIEDIYKSTPSNFDYSNQLSNKTK